MKLKLQKDLVLGNKRVRKGSIVKVSEIDPSLMVRYERMRDNMLNARDTFIKFLKQYDLNDIQQALDLTDKQLQELKVLYRSLNLLPKRLQDLEKLTIDSDYDISRF